MEAEALKERFQLLNENLLQSAAGKRVVRTKALYGANSSGKTNFLLGLSTFMSLATSRNLSVDLSLIKPFLRADYLEDAPSEFELTLQSGTSTFRYGLAATTRAVIKEWLYVREGSGKEAKAFERNGNAVKFGPKLYKEWSPLPMLINDEAREMVRSDGLVLLQALNLGVPQAKSVREAFGKVAIILGGGATDVLKARVLPQLKDEVVLGQIQAFLKRLGIEMEELIYVDKDTAAATKMWDKQQREVLTKINEPTVMFVHRVLSQDGTAAVPIAWPMEHGESMGTQKVFWLAAFIISALKKGEVLVIDEFEASLHPRLTEAIIESFQQPAVNTAGGQLIIATHDTGLLSPSLLRRDQIAFVEKNADGASELYALSDITGIRNDRSYEKDYLSGKFGAVPDFDLPLVTAND